MKRRHLESKFIEELEKVHIISVACEKVGLSRQTIYCWMRKDPKFAERVRKAMEMGNDSVNDLAESKLVGAINKGEPWAIKFRLSNRHKDYKPKKPMTEFEQKFEPVKTIIINEYTPEDKPTYDRPSEETDG